MAVRDTNSASPSSSKPAGRRLLLIALSLGMVGASLLVGLFLGEVVVRTVAPQQLIEFRSDIYRGADSLAWEHQPNVRGNRINTGEREIQLYTDAGGNRVAATGRTQADTKVLLIGDSFAQALQVDYPQTFGALLEQRLPAKWGALVYVRNTGVSGWAGNHYAIKMRRELDRDTFQLAIVTVTLENDEEGGHIVRPAKEPNLEHKFHVPTEWTFGGLVEALAYPINDALETRSHLFILVRHAFQQFLMKKGLSPLPLPVWYYRDSLQSVVWDSSSALLNEAAQAADAHHISTLFVLLPSSFQVNSADFNRYVIGFGIDSTRIDLNQPNRLYKERLERYGRTVIDATPALRAANERGVRTHGRFDPHLSPEGHVLVAELIEAKALELLKAGTVLPKPPTAAPPRLK
ncbi:MAG: SGNH/GDSL hydrolase family protein [Phycisphaerae bacterium]|nr:SGNH/GDSL hydrolase family protein [Gemmatimonadaceae bacterium]